MPVLYRGSAVPNGLIFCRCVRNWFGLPVIGSTLMPNLIIQHSAGKGCFREWREHC